MSKEQVTVIREKIVDSAFWAVTLSCGHIVAKMVVYPNFCSECGKKVKKP